MAREVGRSIAAAMRIMMKGGGGGMDSKKDDFGNNIKSLFTTHGIEVETSQQHGNGSRKMKYLTDVNRFSGGWLVGGPIPGFSADSHKCCCCCCSWQIKM